MDEAVTMSTERQRVMRATLDEAYTAIRKLEQMLSGEAPTASRHESNAERVERLLAETRWPLTVAEIARSLDIPEGSVRMVMFQQKHRFEAVRQSARKVKWTIRTPAMETAPA